MYNLEDKASCWGGFFRQLSWWERVDQGAMGSVLGGDSSEVQW